MAINHGLFKTIKRAALALAFIASFHTTDAASQQIASLAAAPQQQQNHTSAPGEVQSAITLTPDSSKLLHLNNDAASIIVANPAHLSVLAENPRLLVLIPKQPGATSFTVLDGEGNTIHENHVIIAAPTQNYVRIRRSCNGQNSEDCQQTSVFYCPDMCHSIHVGGQEQTGNSGASNAQAHNAQKNAQASAAAYEPPAPQPDPSTDE